MTSDSRAAPNGATALSTKPDAAIIEAWARRTAARAELDRLGNHDSAEGNYSPAEQAQWTIIDGAELVIQSATATTPRGAEIQIWTALAHSLVSDVESKAVEATDLDWLHANHERFDWSDKLFIAALRSLRAMQAPCPDTSAWDAALAEYQPIRQRWAEDFDEGEALPTPDERYAAYKAFQQRVPQYQAARDKFMAVPAPTIAALAIKMEIADPADNDHHELCKIDAQRLAGAVA